LIETIAANQPRFDFDPISGECRGLLIEEQRTNLIVGSNSFGGGSADCGITASAAVSPDGTTNASKIFEKTTNNYKIYTTLFTAVAGTTYCGSVFVKAGERKTMYFKMSQSGDAVNGILNFNMSTGRITGTGGSPVNYGVIPYPNGWYRIYVTFTPTVTSCSLQIFVRNDTSGALTYQGDGSSGFYAYGMQVEAGAFPTSYIPTTASTVTRSADNASMTGTNFSSWYNSIEGTIFTQAKSIATLSGITRRFLEIVNTTGTERYLLGYSTTSNARFLVTASNINQADISLPASPSNGVKICGSYATNNFSSAINGTLGTRDIVGLIANVDRMVIGWDTTTSTNTNLNGTISRLTYYPKALSPAELQYLTQ
jgi:hypothetical protein